MSGARAISIIALAAALIFMFTKEWAGRCHPLGWLRNAHENTLGTLYFNIVAKTRDLQTERI